MSSMRWNLAGCLLAAFAAGLAGCESTLLSTTHAKVVRFRLDGATRNQIGHQTLDVELETGQTTLQNADGPTYPSQLTLKTAQQWRDRIQDGSWNSGRIRGVRGAETVYHYVLTLRNEDRRLYGPIHWSSPPVKTLPQSLRLFTQTFHRIDRLAHPISDRINLLD